MDAIDLAPIAQSGAFLEWLGIGQGDGIDFELMGHGEYNLNYLFRHPATGGMLVLRIPMGSQMHLGNQIRYEFEALRLLEPAGRTPRPLYIYDSHSAIPYGFLVMEHLPGRALRYETDLREAARCLADIHNLEIPENSHLLAPEDPLLAILDECRAMLRHYLDSDLAASDTKLLLSSLLECGQKILDSARPAGARCLINTELNSGNFLVNDGGATYLVDWEKPLYACLGQDLGHFLAPTTTFWKTDSIMSDEDIQLFVRSYCEGSARHSDPSALWDETLPFFTMNCLRGVTWCAMAWVEYQGPDRALKDAFTFEKINTYISPEFLERIREDYLK